MTKTKDNLGNEESCLFFIKSLHLIQMTEELTSLNEVHQEVNSEVVLEHIIHAHDEWVLHVVKNVLFKLKTIKEVLVDNDIFSNSFHGIDFLGNAVLNEEDFTESALTNHFLDLEILEFDLRFFYIALTCEDQGAALFHGCAGSSRTSSRVRKH